MAGAIRTADSLFCLQEPVHELSFNRNCSAASGQIDRESTVLVQVRAARPRARRRSIASRVPGGRRVEAGRQDLAGGSGRGWRRL
jgi:hypothetical protein